MSENEQGKSYQVTKGCAEQDGLIPHLRKLQLNVVQDVDMDQQGKKLFAMIGKSVALLDDTDQLIPALRQLGEDHADLGVYKQHFASGESSVATDRLSMFTNDVTL